MSKVTMNRSVSIAGGKTFSRGQEADVEPVIARSWIASGVADSVDGEDYGDAGGTGDGLDALSIKELRAKAKELDVSAAGKKDDLVDRIRTKLAEDGADADDADDADVEIVEFLDRDAEAIIADVVALTDEDRAAVIEVEEAGKNRDDVLAALRDVQEPGDS